MAVNYGTKNVNSDTVGWTRLDVLNALEEVFSDLGFHGGTAKTGVPVFHHDNMIIQLEWSLHPKATLP